MEKIYWAVVAGRPVPVEGRIDLPLVRGGGFPRRAGGSGRTRRQGRGARDDRLPHARSRRPQAGLAGTAPAHRADAPAAGTLRRHRCADPRRCRLWAGAARPTPTAPARTPRWWRGWTSACICMRAAWCCRTRPAARSTVEAAVAAAYGGDVPHPRVYRPSAAVASPGVSRGVARTPPRAARLRHTASGAPPARRLQARLRHDGFRRAFGTTGFAPWTPIKALALGTRLSALVSV